MPAPARLAFVEPMKAMNAPAPPIDDSGAWMYEVKFDGYRVLAIKNGKDVELWSRNKKPLNLRFPSVAEAIARLPIRRCMLDGEVCALNTEGKSSFQLLQNSGDAIVTADVPIVFYTFDVLFEGSKDLRDLPLIQRKVRLDALLLAATDPIRPSLCFTENPALILEKMKAVGAEGAIAKRANSVYETGSRSGSWVKIKFQQSQEFVIVGYTAPRKSRSHFGALLLGCYRGDRLTYCGRVGTGFSQKALLSIYEKIKPLETETPQVQDIKEPTGRWRPPGWKPSDAHWIKPQLVAQVQFTEWTEDKILRHPSFLGLREDKDARDVNCD